MGVDESTCTMTMVMTCDAASSGATPRRQTSDSPCHSFPQQEEEGRTFTTRWSHAECKKGHVISTCRHISQHRERPKQCAREGGKREHRQRENQKRAGPTDALSRKGLLNERSESRFGVSAIELAAEHIHPLAHPVGQLSEMSRQIPDKLSIGTKTRKLCVSPRRPLPVVADVPPQSGRGPSRFADCPASCCGLKSQGWVAEMACFGDIDSTRVRPQSSSGTVIWTYREMVDERTIVVAQRACHMSVPMTGRPTS